MSMIQELFKKIAESNSAGAEAYAIFEMWAHKNSDSKQLEWILNNPQILNELKMELVNEILRADEEVKQKKKVLLEAGFGAREFKIEAERRSQQKCTSIKLKHWLQICLSAVMVGAVLVLFTLNGIAPHGGWPSLYYTVGLLMYGISTALFAHVVLGYSQKNAGVTENDLHADIGRKVERLIADYDRREERFGELYKIIVEWLAEPSNKTVG